MITRKIGMRKRWLGLFLAVTASTALWAIPSKLTFQAVLKDQNGVLLQGTKQVSLQIKKNTTTVFTEPASGTRETTFTNGAFKFELGKTVSLNATLLKDNDLEMEFTIGGEVVPRIPFSTYPYAMLASEALTVSDGVISNAKLATGNYTNITGLGTLATQLVGVTGRFTGTVTANKFVGDGSGLTGISSGVSGTGTANYVARWTTSTALGGGKIYDNGTNVGIGTTSPSTPLHIIGNSSNHDALYVKGLNTDFSKIRLDSVAGASTQFAFFQNGSQKAIVGYRSSTGMLHFSSNDADILNMNVSNGKIGIGTTAPDELLSVGDNVFKVNSAGSIVAAVNGKFSGTVTANKFIGDGSGLTGVSGSLSGTGTTGYLARWTSGTAMGSGKVYDDGTNVGIGTSSPSTPLHIIGNVDNQDALFVKGLNPDFSKIRLDSVDGASTQFAFFQNGTQKAIVGYRSGTHSLHFSSTESDILNMNIDTNRVGIGTASPASLLSVGSSNGFLVNDEGKVTASAAYVSGTVTANAFAGNGSRLTNLTIANNAITTAKINDSAVTDAKIATVNANKVKVTQINQTGITTEVTLDWSASVYQKITINNSSPRTLTVSFVNPSHPTLLVLVVRYTNDSSVTVLGAWGSVTYDGDRGFTASPSSAIDIFTLYFDGTSYYILSKNVFGT
jgi:hypothetical protein